MLSAELALGKCGDFSAIPEPATKKKLHMCSTKTSDLMILSLHSKICRVGMVVSPIQSIGCKNFVLSFKLKSSLNPVLNPALFCKSVNKPCAMESAHQTSLPIYFATCMVQLSFFVLKWNGYIFFIDKK